MANAINAFLEDYGLNQIIQTTKKDEKEKDYKREPIKLYINCHFMALSVRVIGMGT